MKPASSNTCRVLIISCIIPTGNAPEPIAGSKTFTFANAVSICPAYGLTLNNCAGIFVS